VTKPVGRWSRADEHFIDFLVRPQGATVLCFCPSTFDSYILMMNYCAIMHRRDRWWGWWHYSLLNVTAVCHFLKMVAGPIVETDRVIM